MKSKYKYFVESDEKSLSIHEFPDGNFEFDDDMLNADDTPDSNIVTSQPYIIKITNTSGSILNDIKVLGADRNLGATNFGNGIEVDITMGISGITYAELLFQTLTQPFTVGLTYMLSTNINQTQETCALQYRDANGNITQKIIVPILDPYQSSRRAVVVKDIYSVDGTATIVIRRLLSNSTVRLYLYPTEKINLRNGLADRPIIQSYGNPDIVRHQPVKISESAKLALKNK